MSLFDAMLAAYEGARRDMQDRHYAEPWDIHDDFAALIARPELWPAFQSNGINASMGGPRGDGASGRRDIKIRVAEPGTEPPAVIGDGPSRDKLITAYEDLCRVCGRDFVAAMIMPDIGRPLHAKHDGLRLNLSDLRNIHAAWRIKGELAGDGTPPTTIVEIGGGFGNLADKLRRLYPTARIVVIDLPEGNAMQTYFLSQAHPEARIATLADFQEKGADAFFADDWDFALLPATVAVALPDLSADLFVNIRSMMEMSPDIIASYFDIIHRALKPDRRFYCVNRYHKEDIGQPVRIKDYPFDDRWRLSVSQPNWSQPHIHELMAMRTADAQAQTMSRIMAAYPPYTFADAATDWRRAPAILWTKLVGAGALSGNPGLLRTLRGLGENPRDPLRRLRRWIGRKRRGQT